MRWLCVYCGSKWGNRPDYLSATQDLAKTLVESSCGLVYGGASVGLMGALADAVLAAGGAVVGVIPEEMVVREIAHTNLTRLEVVSSMHERKFRMADLADAFIALPGGLGTLEELFEMLTWSQLGIHQKPVGLLNSAGYFDLLNQFLDHAVTEGFIKPANRTRLLVDNSPTHLLQQLLAQIAANSKF